MRTRAKNALLCMSFIAAIHTAHAQQPGVLRLPWDQWQLHIGDEPSCAQIEAPACTPQQFNHSDLSPANQWRRIEVTLPSELRSTPELGLLVQGEQPVYEVFVNGQSIGGSGSLVTRHGPEYARIILTVPSTLVRQNRIVIAIHGLGVRTSIPVPGFVPTLAPMDQIRTVRDLDLFAYVRASWQHYLCYAAMFGAGFVFFLLFSVNTHLHEYFWIGARLCILAVYRICELSWVVNFFVPAWIVFTADRVFNATSAFVLIQFVFAFLGRPVPKLFRAIQLLGAFSTLSLLLLFPWPSSIYFPLAGFTEGAFVHRSMQLATILGDLSLLLLVPGCFKSKLAEMRWIGTALVFIAFIEANRMLSQNDMPSLPQDFMWGHLDFDLRPLSYVIFAIVMLIAMTFRLRRIQGEVQDENAWVLNGAAGHAGLFCNVPDLLRFAIEVMEAGSAAGRPRLFDPATVAFFARRQSPEGSSRALGWDTPSEHSSSAHYFAPGSIGHLGYSGCSLWIDREAGVAVALLTNRTWPDRECYQIREVRPRFHDALRQAL